MTPHELAASLMVSFDDISLEVPEGAYLAVWKDRTIFYIPIKKDYSEWVTTLADNIYKYYPEVSYAFRQTQSSSSFSVSDILKKLDDTNSPETTLKQCEQRKSHSRTDKQCNSLELNSSEKQPHSLSYYEQLELTPKVRTAEQCNSLERLSLVHSYIARYLRQPITEMNYGTSSQTRNPDIKYLMNNAPHKSKFPLGVTVMIYHPDNKRSFSLMAVGDGLGLEVVNYKCMIRMYETGRDKYGLYGKRGYELINLEIGFPVDCLHKNGSTIVTTELFRLFLDLFREEPAFSNIAKSLKYLRLSEISKMI